VRRTSGKIALSFKVQNRIIVNDHAFPEKTAHPKVFDVL
jgi:hypothetical protein